ncbi:hypothetical protein XM38_023360 [Halomicronema hongdechloris C2206]|uniref:Uncharacterized protein n=1 Tax=Halomicronema hongdechloris C2206 TaxID=1641165 RepID=A0A1Z3HM67_9CYAN|nr:hypothetical protein XM38_023360 [Halomicronema hongdechloris C2206]
MSPLVGLGYVTDKRLIIEMAMGGDNIAKNSESRNGAW